MRFPRRGLLGLAALAGLVMTLLAPAAAFADYYPGEIDYAVSTSGPPDDDTYVPCISVTGAMACWRIASDDLYVYDTAADGHTPALVWDDEDSTRQGTCVAPVGNGHRGVCYKNLTEGHLIKFRAAVYEAGTLVRWSAWFEVVT